MPLIDLIGPKIEESQRGELISRLTSEFIAATGFEQERLDISIRECDGTTSNLLVYTPRLRHSIKRALVAALDTVCAELIPNSKPVVYILEIPYENIGVDGQLLTDADEELSERPFYYVLPR